MPVYFDETFPHHYTAAEQAFDVAEFARQRSLVSLGAERPFFIPPEIEEEIESVSAVSVRVTPAGGEPWTGVFACGFDSPKVASGLFSCPDPNRVCVVAAGYGYIVIAADPKLWERVIAQPVMNVYPAREAGLLLFADFTNISAYGPEGIVWRSERLTWEGLRITSVTAAAAHGYGWDMPRDREVEFTLELKTGEHTGGAAPGR